MFSFISITSVMVSLYSNRTLAKTGGLLFSEGKWRRNGFREKGRCVCGGGAGRSERRKKCGLDVMYERRINF